MRSGARDRFIVSMVDWLNRRFAPEGRSISSQTPLFESGLINSIRILEIIAWTERAIGHHISDPSVRMDNFRTVERIADAFVTEEGELRAAS